MKQVAPAKGIHWEYAPLGLHANTIVPMRDKPERLDGPIPWVRIEDFTGKYISDSKSGQGVHAEAVRSMNLRVFPVGTVICTCSCTMGATAIVAKPLVSNQTFIGLVPRKTLDSGFLYYLMQASSDRLQSIATGAIQQYLSRDDFRRLRVPLPSLQDQCTISGFLDEKTVAIDALIKKKERLITLIEEKRQALITQAVTKGLDPNVPMKDSGIVWLGRIPENWQVKRLKHCLEPTAEALRTGPFGTQLTASDMCGDTAKVYNQRTVFDRDFEMGSDFVTADKFEELLSFEVFPDDVLITSRGTIGRTAVVPEWAPRGILHPCLIRMQPNHEWISSEYLAYILQECFQLRSELSRLSNATTIDVIYSYVLKELPLPVPPVCEQVTLLGHLLQVDQNSRVFLRQVQAQLSLLREYRQSLITAAVMGKIDVTKGATV